MAKAKQTHSRIAARLTEDMAEVAAQATKKKDSTISTLVEKKLKKLKLKELRELLQNQNRSTLYRRAKSDFNSAACGTARPVHGTRHRCRHQLQPRRIGALFSSCIFAQNWEPNCALCAVCCAQIPKIGE